MAGQSSLPAGLPSSSRTTDGPSPAPTLLWPPVDTGSRTFPCHLRILGANCLCLLGENPTLFLRENLPGSSLFVVPWRGFWGASLWMAGLGPYSGLSWVESVALSPWVMCSLLWPQFPEMSQIAIAAPTLGCSRVEVQPVGHHRALPTWWVWVLGSIIPSPALFLAVVTLQNKSPISPECTHSPATPGPGGAPGLRHRPREPLAPAPWWGRQSPLPH